MRRGLVLIAFAAALFAVATLAGFFLMARAAPDWVRHELEARLTAAAHAPVTLEAVRVRLKRGIRLEAEGATFGPGGDGIRASAPRVVAWIDPIRLVLGQVDASRIVLEGALVELPPPPADATLADALRQVVALADVLRSGPVRRLEIANLGLRLGEASGRSELVIDGVDGETTRAMLGRRARIVLRGHVGEGGEGGGAFHLEAETGRGDASVALRLDAVELADLPRALRPPGPVSALQGRLRGDVRLEIDDEGQFLDLDLVGHRVAGRLPPSEEGPRAFALAHPRVSARIEVTPGRVRVTELEMADGDVPLRLEGDLALPVRDASPVKLEVSARDLALEDARTLIERLPVEATAASLDPVEAGRVSQATLRVETTVEGLRSMLAGEVMDRPGELELELDAESVRMRLGDSLFEGASGRLRYDGDTLVLEGVEATLDGEPLPRLDGTLRGLRRLRSLDELRCATPKPVGPLPGVAAVEEYIDSHRKERSTRAWWRLGLEADWVSHPILLCGLEQLRAEIQPIEDGFEVHVERAVWAGAEVEARVRHRRPSEGRGSRVSFDATLGSPFEAIALVPPSEPWAQGHFEFERKHVGIWRLRIIQGAFEVHGDRLLVPQGEVALDPGGMLYGDASLELGEAPHPHYALHLRGRGLDATELAHSARLREARQVTGTVDGEFAFAGPLVPEVGMLGHADGSLRFEAHDGAVARDMPILFAMLVADEPLSPLSELNTVPYERVDVDARLVAGTFQTDRLSLEGPKVRMVGTGRVGAEGPHPVEAVMGVLFFPAIDSLIDRLPILNRVILGDNGNLLGAYYELSGPWEEPTARLIPVKSLVSAGPTSFVFEDLPSFLWSGLKRIHSLLLPRGGRPPSVEPSAQVDS